MASASPQDYRIGLGSPSKVSAVLRLGADSTFSWWVLILYALPSFGTNLIYDPQRLGGNPINFIPVALVTYAVTVVAFAIARYAKAKWTPDSGLVYALGVYLLIGWIRGVTAYYTSLDMGVGTTKDLLFRLISPPIFALTAFAIFAAIVTTARLQRDSVQALAQEQARLRNAIATFTETHERLKVELLARVNAIVAPAIAELAQKLRAAGRDTNLGALLTDLQDTSDAIVRPLSHEIATERISLDFDASEAKPARAKTRNYRNVAVELMPAWGSLLAPSMEFAPQAVTRNVIDAAMVAILLALSLFVTLKVLEGYVARLRLSQLGALALTVVVYVFAGVFAPMFWMRTRWHLTVSERITFGAIVLGVGLAISFISYAISTRRRSIAQSAVVNENMNQLLSQLRQQVWLDRRRVATVLHGPVQGALQSAAIRLGRAPQITDALISEIQRDISDSFDKLNGAEPDGDMDFEVILDSVLALWEDTVDFKISLDPQALRVLRESPDATESTVEILREALNNAMKHGHPELVSINLAIEGDRLLRLTVCNDGSPLEGGGDKPDGYGSTLMQELALRWTLANTTDGVCLTADIVY